MNTTLVTPSAALEDQFGRRLAARLSAGNMDLPHEVAERLRAARVQAVARRKMAPQLAAPIVLSNGSTATLGSRWWMRIGSVVPLVGLLAGLIVISVMQDDNRADQLAEIDSALLTDDLPPSAYADPGFAQFVRTSARSER